ARRLCRQVVERWITKDASPMRETVHASVAELWDRLELGGEQFMACLEKACEATLGQPPQAVLAQALEPLAHTPAEDQDAFISTLGRVLNQIEQTVGRPDESVGNHIGLFSEPLARAADALVADRGGKLSKYIVQLIERPGLRLAGAEEAVRRLITTIEEVLQHYEELSNELTKRVADSHARIGPLMASIQAGSPSNRRTISAAMNGLIELMRVFSQWRYQELLVQQVAKAYVSLRGNLSDELREINYCRTRLGELLRSFEKQKNDGTAMADATWCRHVFQPGCRTLND